MTATQKTKTVDKLTLGKKLVALLKKRYQPPPPGKQEPPVLETLLTAICLEDTSIEEATASYQRLLASFHDLNELRVSSISELAVVFEGAPDADWRAHRIRNVLQHVFEKNFEFVFEGLRRKTLELATKQLGKIRDLSPFVRNYTLHAALGTHVVPVDRLMTNAAIWLGLVHAGETPDQAAEALKSVVRKADVQVFCDMLRCLAVDPRLIKYFEPPKNAPHAGDPQTMIERLQDLFKEADAAARKAGKKTKAGSAARRSDGHDRPQSAKARRAATAVRKKK